MTLTEFLDARLDSMLAHPHAWGSAEAYEAQVLLLLEIRTVLGQMREPAVSLRLMLDAYVAFLAPRRPGLGPRPLAAVHPDDPEAIARYLADFREACLRRPDPSAAGDGGLTEPPNAPEVLGVDVVVAPSAACMPRAA